MWRGIGAFLHHCRRLHIAARLSECSKIAGAVPQRGRGIYHFAGPKQRRAPPPAIGLLSRRRALPNWPAGRWPKMKRRPSAAPLRRPPPSTRPGRARWGAFKPARQLPRRASWSTKSTSIEALWTALIDFSCRDWGPLFYCSGSYYIWAARASAQAIWLGRGAERLASSRWPVGLLEGVRNVDYWREAARPALD